MDLEIFGLPIIRKEESIKEMELYENDTSDHNVFYATLRNKEKLFLLEIPSSKIKNEKKNDLHDLIKVKHNNILSILYIMTKNFDFSYLCFEFSDILISSYITCAIPDINIRLLLLKQLTEYIIYCKQINLKLDKLDSRYIFIEGLDNPTIKILHHNGFLYSNTISEENNYEDCPFYWLSYMIAVIFRFYKDVNNISDYGDYSKLYEIVNNKEIENLFKKMINDTIKRMKNKFEKYSIEDFVNNLNNIFLHYKIQPIILSDKEADMIKSEEIKVNDPIIICNEKKTPDESEIKQSVNNIKLTSNTVNIINNNTSVPNYLSMNNSNMPNFYPQQNMNKSMFESYNSNQINPFNQYLLMNPLIYQNEILKQYYMNAYYRQIFNNYNIYNNYNMLNQPDYNNSNYITNMLQYQMMNSQKINNISGMNNLNLLLMLLNKNMNMTNTKRREEEIQQPIKNNLNEELLNKHFLGRKREDSELKPEASKINKFDEIQESSIGYSEINKVDNKNRNFKKKSPEQQRTNFLEEKSAHLKIELEKYLPLYEMDKHKICSDPIHSFMNDHFPEMYRIDNFYLHLKVKKEKWNKSKKEYIINVKNDYTIYNKATEDLSQENTKDISIMKIWDPNVKSEKEVDDFLFSIEKVWPFDEYNWSQEFALEFLMINDYDVEKTKNLISSRDKFYIEFMNNKIYSSEIDLPKMNESNKKTIITRLRRNKVFVKI